MYIHQAILHILDKDAGNLFLSQEAMDLSSPLIRTYLDKLLTKVQKAEPKRAKLEADSALWTSLKDDQTSLIDKSTSLADKLFDLIGPAEEIAAADYLFFEASDDHEQRYFGLIRLDYSSQVTHFLSAESQLVNQLVMHHAILPSPTQTPSEFFLLNLATGDYQILEKQYVIEGKRCLYLSERILEIAPPQAAPQQIKQIKKAVADTAKQFDQEPYQALATTQKVILQQLEEDHVINAEEITRQVFKDNLGAQDAAREALVKREVPTNIAVNNVPKYEKKYAKQKFKLANGIELMVPTELYDDPEVIEFINNPDGSISVMIKNVETIVNAFNG